MGYVELKANAKLNLTLEVLSRRADGYHELRMLMHSVGVYDTLRIETAEKGVLSVDCNEFLPENNTARRAAEGFIEETGCGGVRISVKKGIRSEAGMGGASADAAGVLRGMELLYGKLDEAKLYALGKSVGADVPFCLHGGCALVEGIGEKLTALEPVSLPLLIVKGDLGVSTGALFRSLTPSDMNSDPHISQTMLNALKSGTESIAAALHNALSPAAEKLVPTIARQREMLIESGALGACMTGSGSAVFGIFDSLEKAEEAEKHFSGCAFTAVCKSVSQPIELLGIDLDR